MIKKLIKNLIIILFILVILGGIGAGIYFLSPEVKPGEVALLYKVVGKDKGFTGKVLTPGKYYAFITEYNPFIYKIYKIKLPVKVVDVDCTVDPGIILHLNVVYGVKKGKLNDFLSKVGKNESDKIVKLYTISEINQILIKYKIEDIFADDFGVKLQNQLTEALNRELGFFGIKVNLADIKGIIFVESLQNLYKKYEENQKELAKLEMETAKKLKKVKLANKIKEENLQYMLKKAEIETKITKLKVERMSILREAAKKRIEEEVELFSKPGGALAAKLEAIRILSASLKKPEKVLNKVESVFKNK